MKINFLGHGLHNSYTNTVGDWMISTFKDTDYSVFQGFSAFTKMSGLNMIKKELLIAKKNFKSIKFYLGIVEKGTSREALQFFLDNEIETYIYQTDEYLMFHPKIYYFKGKHNSRFIIGSSNLTKAGLFENIEASTIFEFSNNDASGKKFVRQYEQYFLEILNSTDKDTQLLTSEVLLDLIESGFVYGESKTNDEFDFTKKNRRLSKRRKKRKFNKKDVGSQKTETKPKNKPKDGIYIPKITDEYLNSWMKYFELFKEFKKENSQKGNRFSVTVPRDYKNASLYTWFQKQKLYFKNDMLIEEHLRLLKTEKFYFGDAHILWQEYKEEVKLNLLTEALLEDEDVKVNHRYEYKGVRLGTWLVGVSQANKKGKKLELREKIKSLGFFISATSRNAIDTANRFVSDLLDDTNPNKANYQNRFNSAIRDRIDEIPEEIQQDLVDSWFLQFDEIRPLGKIRDRQKDKTDEWKAFRYNKTKNPENKWFSTYSLMGDLYSWVRQKREVKSRMDLVKHKFNEQEKSELRKEGFPI